MDVCLTRKRVDGRARPVLDSPVNTTGSGRVVGRSVTILTAHKILIASAVALFLGYAVWELLRYPDPGGPAALVRSGLSGGAAIGLGIYLRAVFRRGGWVSQGGKPPGRPRR
jgi:hypothetical protein